jgi:carbon storage regulator
MLVLTRQPREKIVIGDSIILTVAEVQGDRVRLGIDAPAQVRIRRGELVGWGDIPDPDLEEKPPQWSDGERGRSRNECSLDTG